MGSPDAPEPWQPDPGEIVEILSHELRSPITTIHLGTRLLHDSYAKIPAPVRREVAAAAEEEAERLYRLVEDLLAVARHERGANPLPVRPLLLQRWLAARPAARTITELQRQLDEFREHYNEQRPHRALNRRTPSDAYRATPKATPASNGHAPGHYRLRYDRLDSKGKMTLRRAGRMHHLHAGIEHARKRVLAFADDHHVTITELTTGEVLSTHLIEPEKTYWRNKNKKPGRWPGS